MSFGWSAGDIAAAITLVYNLVEALDSHDGAAGDYREAVAFLRDLKRTLEPLRAFTAWQTYPEYGREIGEQVEHIKEPIGKFLDKVLKYEPSLGAKAAEGHHRHILRKLQWYLFMSKKVSNLRKKIESNMRIIDSLMQRLTLDIVSMTQQRLPNDLRTTFQEVLRLELIAVLRENLPPLHPEILEHYQERQIKNHEALVSKLSGYYEGISSDIDTIKFQLRNSNSMGERLQYSIKHRNVSPEDNTTQALLGDQRYPASLTEQSDQRPESRNVIEDYDSLREVYYLVFLYLGYFLKNLFLLLLRLVQPSRSLVPRLLAKENILFLDAIGRPPRILPYEYFRCFKVLQAFIQYEFKNLPGSAWVKRGRYMVLSLASNQALDEFTWTTVTPGSKVAMSMVVRKLLNSASNPMVVQCPERSCSGTWAKDETEFWVKCPICHKEVLNSVSNDPDAHHDGSILASEDLDKWQSKANLRSSKRQPTPRSSGQQESPTSLTETSIQKELEINEDDISIFKRVVQQIIHSDKPLSGLGNTNNLDSPSVTQRGASSSISRLRHTESRQMEDWDYTPLVYEYLSLLKEKDRVSKRLHDLVNEKTGLEKEQEAQLRFGLALDPTDQDRLGEVEILRDKLAQEIKLLDKDIESTRLECFSMGLIDEDLEPIEFFQKQEQAAFRHEWDLDPEDQISDFIKYPLLLPGPRRIRMKSEGYELIPEERSDITTSRINKWMLDRLRSSPLEVNLLARTFEGIVGKAQGDWQSSVLQLWHKDGTVNTVKKSTAKIAPSLSLDFE